MRNFRISIVAAAPSTMLLASPLLAEAATTTPPQTISASGMMASGKHGGCAMMAGTACRSMWSTAKAHRPYSNSPPC